MADVNIQAVITAQDRASGVLRDFGRSADKLGQSFQGLDSFITKWAKRATIAAGGVAASFITLGVRTAADLESAKQGFITLLGSVQKADRTIARIKKEAARTPFEILGLTQATQLLAAVTKDGDKAVDVVLDVGEALAAAGRGQAELDRISVNLQQIAATGRAMTIDIRQFALAGIPIYQMLQEETGKTGDALEKFIEGGGVSFEMLTRMFDEANDKGGRFFEAFKRQFGTFNQQWSNLKDTLATTAADIVIQTGLFDRLKDGMKAAGDWIVQNKDAIAASVQNVIDKVVALGKFLIDNRDVVLKVIQAYVLLKVAMFINNAVQALLALLGLARTGLAVTRKAVDLTTARFRLLGLTMGGIPAAIAIAVAVAGIAKVITEFLELRRNIDDLRASADAASASYGRYQAKVGKKTGLRPEGGDYLPSNIKFGKPIKKKPPGHQLGGPMSAGMPYMVGEAGPEMIVPRNRSTVIPNNKLSKQSAATQIHIHVGTLIADRMGRRKFAELIMRDLKDVASMRGTTLAKLVGT